MLLGLGVAATARAPRAAVVDVRARQAEQLVSSCDDAALRRIVNAEVMEIILRMLGRWQAEAGEVR